MSNQGDGLFVGALYSSLAELEYAVNSWAVHNATKLGLRSGSGYGEDQLRRWVCESWTIPSLACKFKDCLLDIEAVCLPLQNCWRIVTFSPQHISEAQWEEWTSFDLLRQMEAMQTSAMPSQNDRDDSVSEDNPTPADVPRRTDDNGCNVEHDSMPGPSSLQDHHSIRRGRPRPMSTAHGPFVGPDDSNEHSPVSMATVLTEGPAQPSRCSDTRMTLSVFCHSQDLSPSPERSVLSPARDIPVSTLKGMPSGISRRRPTSARQTTVIAPATAENAAESDLHAETATDNALNGSRGMQVEPLLSEADNIAIKIDEERDAIDILASQAAHRADGMVPSSTCEMDELLDLDISPAEGPLITPFANEDIVENTAIEQGLSNIAPHDVSSPVARPPSSSPLTALLDSHSTSEKPQLPFFRTPKGLDEWFNDRLEGSWEHEMSQFDRKSSKMSISITCRNRLKSKFLCTWEAKVVRRKGNDSTVQRWYFDVQKLEHTQACLDAMNAKLVKKLEAEVARESKPIPTKRPERTRRWFRKAKTDKEGGSEARTSHHSDTEHQLPPDVSTEETSVLQEGFSSISTSEQLQSPSDQIMKTPQRCSSAHPTSVKDAPVDREHVQRGISLAPGVVDGPAESTEAHSRNVEKTDVFMQGSEENSSHSQTMQGFPELRIPQLGEQSERSFSLATGDVMTHIEGNHHSHNSSTSGREAPMVHGNTFDEDMPPLDDNLPLENFVEDTGSNEVVAQADSHVEATPELIDSNARSRHERSYSFSSTLTPLSSEDEAQTPNSPELKQTSRADAKGSSEPRLSANKRQRARLRDSRILSQDVRRSERAVKPIGPLRPNVARLTTTPALESTSKHSTPATDSEISDFLFEEDSDEDEEMRAARLRLASRRSLSTSANRKRRMASARGSKSKKKRMIFGAGANLETFLALENPGKVSVWEDSDEDRNVPRRKANGKGLTRDTRRGGRYMMPDSDEEGGVDDEVLCISTDDESDEEEEAAQAKPGRSAKNDALSEVNKEEINEALQETAENDTDLVNMKVRDASVRSGTVQEDEGEGGMIENMLNNGAFLDQNIDDQGANYRLSSPSTAQIAEQDRLLEAEHDELEEDIPNDLTESHTDKTVDAKSNLVPNSPVVKREEDEDEGNLPNTPEANSFTSSNPVIPSSITMSAEVSFHTTITTQNHHHPFEAEFDNQSNASRSPTLPSSFQDAFREIEEDLSQAEERRLARMPRFGEFSPL